MGILQNSGRLSVLDQSDRGQAFLGAPVGHDESGRLVRMPVSGLPGHFLVHGLSGVGKSRLLLALAGHRLALTELGVLTGPLVMVDPGGGLSSDFVSQLSPSVANGVRRLDFGSGDRVPAVNLLDPVMFPDQERCVDVLVSTFRGQWEFWGGRTEDILRRSLSILYQYNCDPRSAGDGLLSLLEVQEFLRCDEQGSAGRSWLFEASSFQERVLSRVQDPRLVQWLNAYLGWGRETREDAMAQIVRSFEGYAGDARSRAMLGQSRCSFDLNGTLAGCRALLLSLSRGSVGNQAAALVGSALAAQVLSGPVFPGGRGLFICDDFHLLGGVGWLPLLESDGGAFDMVLSTRSLGSFLQAPKVARFVSGFKVLALYRSPHESVSCLASRFGGMPDERTEWDVTGLGVNEFVFSVGSPGDGTSPLRLTGLPPLPCNDVSPAAVLRGSEDCTVPFEEAAAAFSRGAVAVPV